MHSWTFKSQHQFMAMHWHPVVQDLVANFARHQSHPRNLWLNHVLQVKLVLAGEILSSRKQFVIKIEFVGRALFFSKLLMIFRIAFLQYLAFRDLVAPWSIGCVVDVVFGGKKVIWLLSSFQCEWMWGNYLLLVQYFFFGMQNFSHPLFKQDPIPPALLFTSVLARGKLDVF